MRKSSYMARAFLCAGSLFVCAQRGGAQSPELPHVPEELADSLKAILSTERQNLVSEESRIRASVIDHDGKCRQVVAGSAAASACAARRDSLRTAAAKLGQDIERFSNAVTELNRLLAEESTLTQAIRNAVETMRSMIDDVTAAGQERLSALSEQLKTQLATRSRYRVRQATVVLGVRG